MKYATVAGDNIVVGTMQELQVYIDSIANGAAII